VKKPKWLGWESSETNSDDLKKVRRQTDQRMKQQDVQKAQRDEAEKKNRSPSAPPETARRGRAINSRRRTGRWPGAIGNPVWRILRLTPHSGDDRCPLFSLDVQLADQSRAEKTRSKSLDLTNHLPSRLSTMNWIGAVI
jgi:hypothetical protein